ncbi:MAG: putative metallopeptidase [Blastocatellia bacterium]
MQPAEPQTWSDAPPVRDVANKIINQRHSHLGSVEMRYFFFSKEIKSGDEQIWGRARKVTGLNAVLVHPNEDTDKQFFTIEIWRTIWDRLTPEHREALVDHELHHCWVDDNGKLQILKHDLEEFANVVRRYGPWRSNIQIFLDAANGKGQGSLFDEEKPAPTPEPEYEGEPAFQNSFPMPIGAEPRQLNAAPTKAISNGSTAMPGTEPRQLPTGHCPVRCPECNEYSQQPIAEINSWTEGEIDLQCDLCQHKFTFNQALLGLGLSPDYSDAIDAEFIEIGPESEAA